MKIAPISGDLLVKVALVLAGAAALAWIARKAAGAAGDVAGQAWNAAADAAWSVTPWNNQNVISHGVNNAIFPAGDQTIGTWLYGVLNPAQDDHNSAYYVPSTPQWDVTPQGPYGPRYNNPSAYTAPGYTGSGGAAFGIYPRP